MLLLLLAVCDVVVIFLVIAGINLLLPSTGEPAR